MFVRRVTSRYRDRIYVKYVLAESVRTPKGPRQRIVCSLGDLRPRSAEEWLELARKVEAALVGQIEMKSAQRGGEEDVAKVVRRVRRKQEARLERRRREAKADSRIAVDPDRIRTERHREAGTVHVGYQMWRRLGLDEILTDIGLPERARTLTCAMVLNRLIYPCSEHAMPDWIRRTALDDIQGTDFSSLSDDTLYQHLDVLHPRRAAIEARLSAREDTLFNLDQAVLLYDLTSTYFEGQAKRNPKAQRGYSRDHRPDCKQVVVGLVLNRDGFPRAHEIYAGNTQDRNTVGPMLDLLAARVGLKPGQMVVVDRGMAYEQNLDEIKARKLHWLVAARQPERDRWLAEFDDDQGFEEVIREPSPLNPGQTKTQVRVKLCRTDRGSDVLCHSEARVLKDRAIREKKEKKLLADMDKLAARVARGGIKNEAKVHEAIGRLKERYPRVARYYKMTHDAGAKTFSYMLDSERRARAEALDGSYLLRTDRTDLTAEEAWRIYILLTRVENAFRTMKSPLEERPIFHHKEQRVETHIFLCVLAYHLLISIEKTLLDKGVHTSWESVRETLQTHQVCTVVLPAPAGLELHIRRASTPEPAHRALYDLLAMPHQPIRPTKTWLPERSEPECSDQKSD